MKKSSFSTVTLLVGILLAFTLVGCEDLFGVLGDPGIDPVYQGRITGTLGSDTGSTKPVEIGSRSIAYASTRENSINGLSTSGGDTRTESVIYPTGSSEAFRSWAYLYRGTEKVGIVYQYAAGVTSVFPWGNSESKVITYYLGKTSCRGQVSRIEAMFPDSACDISDMTDTYHGIGARTSATVGYPDSQALLPTSYFPYTY